MILEARAIIDTEKIERLTEGVRRFIAKEVIVMGHWRMREVIPCAASLAHHGLLGSVKSLRLWRVDLSQVPAQHLTSLASCVTWRLSIENVRGSDLVSLLTSLNCYELDIYCQSLDREETLVMVQAMETGVEKVRLDEKVTLDIEALTEYSGQGICREVKCYDNTAARYREDLRAWARSKKWRIDLDYLGARIDMFTRKPKAKEY